MTTRLTLWIACAALLLPACKAEDDGPKDPSGPNDPNDPMDPMDPMDPPTAWLVGEDGEMLRLTLDEEVSTYPLDRATDFAAIACNGEATAWVVGDGATLLLTRDAGETWNPIELGLPATTHLRSIAVTEHEPEGAETLWVVGDEGIALRSTDGGHAFTPVGSPAVDWTSVATDAHGEVAFAAGQDGSVWRSDAGAPFVAVHAADAEALYDVAVSADGTLVVAVGEGGRVLRSEDAGDRFTSIGSGTVFDLHAVQLQSDATIMAVGEVGVVSRIDAAGPRVQQLLGPDDTLFDLHLRADGFGETVGSGGAVLRTTDAGEHWDPVATGRTADLHGVDDFHPGPHL